MASKLNIYACSGVGDNRSGYDYWEDNLNPINNTQATNGFVARIDLLVAELSNLQLSQSEQIAKLNDLDFYTVCAAYTQQYAGDKSALERIGRVLGALKEQGVFSFDSTNNNARDAHLDAIFDQVEAVLADGAEQPTIAAFENWWNKYVMERDQFGLSEAQRKKAKGIGAAEDALNDENIGQYLTKAADYFLYRYFTPEQLQSLPRVFRKKREYQDMIYENCKGLYIKTYGDEQSMQNLIRTGIVESMKDQPENICASIANRGAQSVGEAAAATIMIGKITLEAFISILTTVLGVLATIVGYICSYATKVGEAKYASLNRSIIDNGEIAPSDYNGVFKDMPNVGEKNTWLPLLAIGAAILLILKK